jgi:RNA polymerase-binding transcription factor DksA
LKRLDAYPTAKRCIVCQQRREKTRSEAKVLHLHFVKEEELAMPPSSQRPPHAAASRAPH